MKIFQTHFGKRRNRVVIDGREFTGSSIGITDDGSVYVDGVEVNGKLVGPVSVTVHGDVDHIESMSGDVEVFGSVRNLSTQSGDVDCGDVTGNVSTISGDVDCGGVGGNVSTVSGDVSAG
ncbi:hypothetical protein [Halomonas sp. BMC6]|uniref:hypothetical protein n=1 Tax=Halomonas sp. BMC6 TaxID=3073244 RepID=UPI0030CFBD40